METVDHAQVLAALAALHVSPTYTGTVTITPTEVTVTVYDHDEHGQKYLGPDGTLARHTVHLPVVNRP